MNGGDGLIRERKKADAGMNRFCIGDSSEISTTGELKELERDDDQKEVEDEESGQDETISNHPRG